MVPASGACSVAPQKKWIDGLTTDLPFWEALQNILQPRWEGVLQAAHQVLRRSSDDTEHVHRLRVASRRLAAVLQTLGRELPGKSCRRVLKVLDRIRRCCGDARDFDVQISFIDQILPHLSAGEVAGVGVIREQLLRGRSKAQGKLRHRLARLVEKLERSGDKLFAAAYRAHERSPSEETFGGKCVELLEKEFSEFWEQSAKGIPQETRLHDLRIACKNLRYTVEVAAPVLGEAFREEFYPQLQKIQTQLGVWNDSVVAEKSQSHLRKKCKGRCDRHGLCELPRTEPISWRELNAGFATLRNAFRQSGQRALDEFNQTWPEFSGSNFRHPVEDLLTSARERDSHRHPGVNARIAESSEREPVGV
jgi:CHAD domain-containing protein